MCPELQVVQGGIWNAQQARKGSEGKNKKIFQEQRLHRSEWESFCGDRSGIALLPEGQRGEETLLPGLLFLPMVFRLPLRPLPKGPATVSRRKGIFRLMFGRFGGIKK